MPSKAPQIRWITFRNSSDEQVPAFGIIRITGVYDGIVGDFLAADKPNAETDSFQYYVNSAIPVDVHQYGKCTEASSPVPVACGGSPSFGDEWGPTNDSWELSSDGSGFVVLGGGVPGSRVYATKMTGGGSGGGCEDRNEKHKLGINGTPTSGSLSIDQTVNGVTEAISIAYNASNTAVKTAYEGHSQISSVTCTGGPLPNTEVTIEFTGPAATMIDPGNVTKGSLVGVGVGVNLFRVTPGHPN